jgi:hypothetical protein
VKWTRDIVVRLEAAAEDVDVLSAGRLEMLLREAVTTIRGLRGDGPGAADIESNGPA